MKLARLLPLHLPRPGFSPFVSACLLVIVVALVFILFRDFDRSALATNSSRDAAAESSILRLHVRTDGTIRWNDEATVAAEELPAKLAAFAGRHHRGRVVVDGDADARFGEIRRSLEAARAAGLRAVTVEKPLRAAP